MRCNHCRDSPSCARPAIDGCPAALRARSTLCSSRAYANHTPRVVYGVSGKPDRPYRARGCRLLIRHHSRHPPVPTAPRPPPGPAPALRHEPWHILPPARQPTQDTFCFARKIPRPPRQAQPYCCHMCEVYRGLVEPARDGCQLRPPAVSPRALSEWRRASLPRQIPQHSAPWHQTLPPAPHEACRDEERSSTSWPRAPTAAAPTCPRNRPMR
eukprot:scaffold392_cov101-Isochrysis_galbana.AAC.15